jgi:hypothetical protein
MHIDDLLFLEDAQIALGILSSCVIHQPSYFTWIIYIFFPFMFRLVGSDKRIMQVCGDIMGLRFWESFQGPLTKHQTQLPISFSGIIFFFYGGLCPICFFKELGFGGSIFVLKVSYF